MAEPWRTESLTDGEAKAVANIVAQGWTVSKLAQGKNSRLMITKPPLAQRRAAKVWTVRDSAERDTK